jgi:hypothetical protein
MEHGSEVEMFDDAARKDFGLRGGNPEAMFFFFKTS